MSSNSDTGRRPTRRHHAAAGNPLRQQIPNHGDETLLSHAKHTKTPHTKRLLRTKYHATNTNAPHTEPAIPPRTANPNQQWMWIPNSCLIHNSQHARPHTLSRQMLNTNAAYNAHQNHIATLAVTIANVCTYTTVVAATHS